MRKAIKHPAKKRKAGKGISLSKKQIMLIVSALVVIFFAWQYASITSRYKGDNAVWIKIPATATPKDANDSIISALGNSFGGKVIKLWSGDVKNAHGAYRIEPGDPAWRIARRLGQGRQTPVDVTFNNVRKFDQLAELIADRMDFSKEDFLAEATNVAIADTISSEALTTQFLPDTYELYWTATPGEVINKIRQNYHKLWDDTRLAKAKALGLTPMQVSVLASIVEEESNRRDERPKIARLYLNRLQKGMKLQADPTVKFAYGDPTARRITGEMLAVNSPYNTYKNPGLPPGVIRLPEAATIDAVLNAPSHNYIYMCARPDGSGYHDFTVDYKTHLQNASTYRSTVYKTTADQNKTSKSKSK